MLRKFKYIALVLLALMASAIGRAQAQTQVNTTSNASACPSRMRSVGRAFDQIYRKNTADIVGMCVGAVGPNASYAETQCYGDILTGWGISPTSHTLFAIGSVTKTMTATLLALRVNQGSVSLDDRVDAYLSSLYHIPKITLLQLADMESGLPRNPSGPYLIPWTRLSSTPICRRALTTRRAGNVSTTTNIRTSAMACSATSSRTMTDLQNGLWTTSTT